MVIKIDKIIIDLEKDDYNTLAKSITWCTRQGMKEERQLIKQALYKRGYITGV